VSVEDRAAFDVVMDICRNKAMASGATCNLIIFESMLMSIMVAQKRKLRKLEENINRLRQGIVNT